MQTKTELAQDKEHASAVRGGVLLQLNKPLFYTRRIHDLYGFRKASYFWMQTRLHSALFARWFDFIDETLPFGMTEVYKVRLAMRPAFRFIDPQFRVADRIEAFIHHYSLFREKFPDAALFDLLQEESGCRLAEIKGKSGRQYFFETRGAVTKEGAFRLLFIDGETGFALSFLVGILIRDEKGGSVFSIGMLRGPGQIRGDSKDAVVKATKDLNGLRPKQAAFHATAALAAWFGAEEIVAPSSQKEIAMKNLLKGHRILANHDPFWQEFAVAQDSIYHIPLPIARRDESEVQQKRRKDWRARYAHIDDFSAQIKAALEVLSKSAQKMS